MYFEKKAGSSLLRFSLATFWAFFIAIAINSVAIRSIGLNMSLVISITSFLITYFLATKILLQKALSTGELKIIGKSHLGVTIFETNDQLANAIAIGISKKFGYIIVSTSFSKIFSEISSEYWAVIDREDTRIRQMHNITELFTQILLLIAIMTVLSIIAIHTPIITIVRYVTVTLLVLFLSRRLHMSLKTMANKSVNHISLENALTKIDEHNRSITNSNKPVNSRWNIFSSHTQTSDTSLKSNRLKDASIAGACLSFLIAMGLIAQFFANTTVNGDIVVFSAGLFFSITIFGSALVVIDYVFLSNLAEYLAEKFRVKTFSAVNALNGIIALMAISAIPILMGISNVAIIGTVTLVALVISIVVSATGTEPLKKGLLVLSISWALNSALYVTAAIILANILAIVG
jgi:hypothetical protein